MSRVIWKPSSKGDFYTDSLKLSRVLSNLIGNAIKFTEDGRITVTCKDVSDPNTLPNHHTIQVEVEDTGIGISKEAQEKFLAGMNRKMMRLYQNLGNRSGIINL